MSNKKKLKISIGSDDIFLAVLILLYICFAVGCNYLDKLPYHAAKLNVMCEECNNKISKDYCTSCGKSKNEIGIVKTFANCDDCDERYKQEIAYCEKCGSKVGSPTFYKYDNIPKSYHTIKCIMVLINISLFILGNIYIKDACTLAGSSSNTIVYALIYMFVLGIISAVAWS